MRLDALAGWGTGAAWRGVGNSAGGEGREEVRWSKEVMLRMR